MSLRPRTLLPVGGPAPNFDLRDGPDSYASLSDYAGSIVVLLFYAADFHPVCIRQLTVFNEALPEFHRLGAQILGISHDAIWSHIAFSNQFNLHFPLLSDYFPWDEAGRAYGVPVTDGESACAVFVINTNQRIVWSHIVPPGIALDPGSALQTVERLVSG
jgi:peroxiredoxin